MRDFSLFSYPFSVRNTLESHLINFTFISTPVPIIPEFLYDIRHPDAPLSSFPKYPPHVTPSANDLQGPDYTTVGYGKRFDFSLHELNNKRFHLDNVSWYAEREERHKELVGETAEVGLMFASKAFVQLLANPIVGPLTHKYILI